MERALAEPGLFVFEHLTGSPAGGEIASRKIAPRLRSGGGRSADGLDDLDLTARLGRDRDRVSVRSGYRDAPCGRIWRGDGHVHRPRVGGGPDINGEISGKRRAVEGRIVYGQGTIGVERGRKRPRCRTHGHHHRLGAGNRGDAG